MKKLISIMIAIMLLSALPCAASPYPEDSLKKASAAILIDVASGKTIIEKNADESIDPAGLVRLPALLLICRAFDEGSIKEDDTVTVSREAAAIKGATAFLSPNESISAGQLLKASVILNAGDAVCALMQKLYPSTAAGLEAVNEMLGALNCGAFAESYMGKGETLSVKELANICSKLADSESFLKYSSVYTDSITHESAAATELVNPNRLVRFYSGCFGIATGSVGSSNYCGAFIARRGTTTLLAVTAGLPDSASRFKLASELLDHGFASYRSVSLGGAGESIGSIAVINGKTKEVELITGSAVAALMPVTNTKLLSETVLPESVEAPIEKDQRIGTLILKNGSGEVLGEVPILSAEAVEKAVFKDYLMDLMRSWLRISR
ncbi:MAG: serine hydrolase [Clostridiales bacterium]|nr:serine hydrolase [Clostridiales bacterium]